MNNAVYQEMGDNVFITVDITHEGKASAALKKIQDFLIEIGADPSLVEIHRVQRYIKADGGSLAPASITFGGTTSPPVSFCASLGDAQVGFVRPGGFFCTSLLCSGDSLEIAANDLISAIKNPADHLAKKQPNDGPSRPGLVPAVELKMADGSKAFFAADAVNKEKPIRLDEPKV